MENWRDIGGFEGLYQVSDLGRVRSLPRQIWVKSSRQSTSGYHRPVKGRVLTLNRCVDGGRLRALNVTLWNGHVSRCETVHVLVLEAFVGPRPSGKYGCHENDVPSDNRLDNLYWGTPTDNCADKSRNGNQPRGSDIYCAVLDESAVAAIRARANATSQSALAREFGVGQSQISRIVNHHQWQHTIGMA